jgi:hypothetical protein
MGNPGERFHPHFRVVDTNVVVQINRLVRAVVQGPAMELADLRVRFRTRLHTLVTSLGACGVATYTTSLVYDEEIDPRSPGSWLRQADPDFFARLCNDDGFAADTHALYQGYFSTEPIADDQIEFLRETAQENLGRRDFSLVCLALQLSHGGTDVVLTTDDGDLRSLLEHLCRQGRVAFGDTLLDTSHLFAEDSLTFLRQVHGCCKLPNEVWMRIGQLHLQQHFDRFGVTEPDRWEQEFVAVSAFLRTVTSDCREKEFRELEQAFTQSVP